MNYDFQLNKNGDILFKQSNRDNSSLQLDFYVAESKGLMFNFYIDSYIDEREYLNDLDPQFIFEFYIDTPKNNKEVLCIENKEDYLNEILPLYDCINNLKNHGYNFPIFPRLHSIHRRLSDTVPPNPPSVGYPQISQAYCEISRQFSHRQYS